MITALSSERWSAITFDLGRGLKKEKSSYSNIFKEKLKYVSTDMGEIADFIELINQDLSVQLK